MNADERRSIGLATERVLGAVFEVTNTLGAGFLEKVYQRALLRELGLRGIRAVAEALFTVTYKGHSAGEYFADLLVEDVLVVERKCVDRFSREHTAQCLYEQADGGVDRGPGGRPTIPAKRFSPGPYQPIPPAPWIPCTPYAWSERAYASFSASRVANLATLMMARSCVPSPIFSFSSRASTRNSTRRPSTRMTSAVNVTLIPIGVAARCATLTCVPTVS